MKRLSTREEVLQDWQETVQTYEKNVTAINIAHDLGNEDLIQTIHFKQRNGRWGYDVKYPTREQIIDFVNSHHLDLDPEYFLEEFCFDEKEPGDRNWYLEDPDIIHYFWGESCYGFGGNQDEENPHLIHFPYHMAFGGPNIWLQYTVKAYFKEDILHIDLHHAEYGHAWWGVGAVINLTEDPNALKIYSNEFEERIGYEIFENIDNGNFKIPNESQKTA